MFDSWLASYKAKGLQEAAARKTPAIRKHDYDESRKSILGEFAAEPVAPTLECMTSLKAQRRKERLNLVSKAVVSCPEHAQAAARLREDMDEVENMRCAKHVYMADPRDSAAVPPKAGVPEPPPGFKAATPEQLQGMGLDMDMLSNDESNFRAAVYMKDPAVWGPNPKPAYVLAFRGSTPETEDWENNFAQNSGKEAPYYRKAVQIGNTLKKNKADVHIVGHSLGGGLASAAQGGSGLTASTYNAAGLNPETVAKYSKDKTRQSAEESKIKAVRVQGETLTKTQEGWMGTVGLANDAVGRKRDIAPVHDEKYFERLKKEGKVDGEDDYETYLHGMDEVIGAMEKQKEADQAELRKCVGRRR